MPDVVIDEAAAQAARDLDEGLGREGRMLASAGRNGKHIIPVPPELQRVLREAIHLLARGETVTVGARPATLTTTNAAAMLGVSRPTLMKWVREGRIPASKVGTHTRINTADVEAFRRARRAEQLAALEALRDLEADDISL